MAIPSNSNDRRRPDFRALSRWNRAAFSHSGELAGEVCTVEPMWGENVPFEGFGTIGRGAFSLCGRAASVVLLGNGGIIRAFHKHALTARPSIALCATRGAMRCSVARPLVPWRLRRSRTYWQKG